MSEEKSLEERLANLSKFALLVNEDVDEGSLHQISAELASLDEVLRENLQLNTAEEAIKVIRKLEAGSQISDEDMSLIRLWMVSDAEFYIQMENDFPDWIRELNRLFGNINKLSSAELHNQALGQISGSIRDALRVIADVVFFREQEDRIRRFENATHTLNDEDMFHLARLLRQKLASADQ